MSALWTDVIEPAELTGYARQTQEDYEAAKGSLSRFLPNSPTDDIVAKYTVGGGGLTEAAEYRAYDSEVSIGDSTGGERKTLELPPVGRKFRNSEYDQLRARGDVRDEAVKPTILKYAAKAARAISDRVELLRGQAIDTAGVSINENGFIATTSFGRRADFNVTAANLWGAANADPIADIQLWNKAYIDENGEGAAVLLTSTKVLTAALSSEKVRALFASGAIVPPIVTRADLNAKLATFDLPQIEVFDRRVKVGTATVRTTPEDKAYLLPAATDPNTPDGTDLGATFWGTTLEASEPEYSIASEDRPGIAVGAYKSHDPIGVWVHGAAIALPVLVNPNLSLAAKVL